MVKKPSMGRQKIDIKKIENPDARQVCFSKRRSGLFKKAAELCLLCNAQVAIIVFSPAGKIFTFGHPSVDSVIERFLRGHNAGTEIPQLGPMTEELSRHCCDLMEQVETEKKKKEVLQERGKPAAASGGQESWWEVDVRGRGLHELEEFKMSLEKLRDNVLNRAEELSRANSALVENYFKLV
ncbi:agamous-like MADS-box protein AGL62 [Aristolochia californica]|uniref:agamous-like MADS-box protein AGL62 n=1 Tax=Aristolochia californica TaxID=171875 RepID=UPI0035E1558E